MPSSSRPPGCARKCPSQVISLGSKGVPYQVTRPLSTKYILQKLFYFLCRMRYECGHKQVSMTMDQLKHLNIPSEMLRFFNHVCPPQMGHPTRSVHSAPHKHTQHALVNAFPISSTFHFNDITNNHKKLIPY